MKDMFKLEGKIAIVTGGAGGIVYIAPGEERDMVINNGKPAEVLVFIVTP